jgi:hypothetical protein
MCRNITYKSYRNTKYKLGRNAEGLTIAEEDWTTTEKHHDLAAVYMTLGLNSAGQGNHSAALQYVSFALSLEAVLGSRYTACCV